MYLQRHLARTHTEGLAAADTGGASPGAVNSCVLARSPWHQNSRLLPHKGRVGNTTNVLTTGVLNTTSRAYLKSWCTFISSHS